MALELEVLGFAGAAPLQGACSSYVAGGDDATVLLDCGPGTLERLWRRGLLDRLDAIVLSHMHADHVLDLVPFAGELVQRLVPGRVPLHVPEGARAVLRTLDRAFAPEPSEATRFDVAFEIGEYGGDTRLEIGSLTVTFAPTRHRQPCFAIRITDGRRTIVYGADGSPSASLERLAADADLLVLEATFADDDAAASASGHMTASQAGELAARAGVRSLLLTHLLADAVPADLVRHAERGFAGPVNLAADGYRCTL